MQIIRRNEVLAKTGLSNSALYAYISEGRFPRPVSLGKRAVGWVADEVEDWITKRVEQRDKASRAA